ncbi:nck-associated protein 5 isoform X2 [Saccopteryx bilineata]|uniref:nck-associated protein 5 isoform X2 n=1 Tax=Saccopteryx bilineata TaxID=59482 RepID=UPI00338ED570
MEGKRQLEKRDFGKRLSLDSSLVEYMDSNKYIEHLLTQLEEKHRSLWREKLAVAQLQREVAQRRNEGAMHEKLIRELEEERHLRLQSEKRLQEVTLESERTRVQMRGLQQQFSRMEETVRNLLQSQGPPEQKKEETANPMVSQEKLSEDERKHKEALEDLQMVVDEDSRSESSSADEGREKTKLLLERLKALEVANQVVQALLTQKDLREECVKLKTRVFDLEQQNRTLSTLFQQRLRPTSDLLLQKLHSHILDLSSGNVLSEVERSRRRTRSHTDAEMHECQLNTKSGSPALRCPSVGVVIPGHLCSHNSCSSSELSLSSTCSEYSSGSSRTWHDGKNLRKRQSSQNWDQRLSIDSSLPSGFASPTDELPPTRIKENHILEGLRKLQKRKVLLEPQSVITKWGYKDCMNSNEGIYSPGIKNSSLKECCPCKPADMGSPCQDPHKAFIYDTDSHNADEDASSLALIQAFPNQACRLHGCQLTHSVSDSLFSWELNGKHFSDGMSSVYPRGNPEKLSSCSSNCPLGRKLCPCVQVPREQRERCLHSHDRVALNLQLSDTDDNEPLDELHIDSSNEKSPSDLSLTADTDKSTENLDILVGLGQSQLGSPDEEEKQMLIHLESKPKTFSFIKQQRVIKRTSSEECVTVIFDAEDGEPIEFSSHQTGVVSVTRNEISISQAPTGPMAEHMDHLPQGTAHLQPGDAAGDYTFAKRPEEEAVRNTPSGGVDNVAKAPTVSCRPRAVMQNTQRQKLAKLTHNVACQSDAQSPMSVGVYQKQSLTKIPTRGKSSPQKSKMMEPEAATSVPSSGPGTLEKSTASASGKPARLKRTEGPVHLCGVQADSHVPDPPAQLPHSSGVSGRRDAAQCSRGHTSASQLLSGPLLDPGGGGEHLVRGQHYDPGPAAGVESPLPLPPGGSASLLTGPSYDCLPLPSSAKHGTRVPSDTARTGFKSPSLKGSSPVISSHQTGVQGKKPSMVFKKPTFTDALPSTEVGVPTRCPTHVSSSAFVLLAQGPPKVSLKRSIPKTPPHQALGTPQTDTGLQTPKNCPSAHEPLDISSKSLSPERKRQVNDSVSKSPKPSFLGVNESLSSQVSSPSPSSNSQNASHGCQSAHEKGLKTRLPVGLKVLMKSPQLLRKSSTVPGKHEKDSLNEASRSSVAASRWKATTEQCRGPASPGTAAGTGHAASPGTAAGTGHAASPGTAAGTGHAASPGTAAGTGHAASPGTAAGTGHAASLGTAAGMGHMAPPGSRAQGSLADGLLPDTATPESSENCIPGADGRDAGESRSVKRPPSSKPHLKPALGMNGAKARSQSFSAHSGDKPPTPPMEGPGRVRTQIITNTAERGNSLTRQGSSTDGSPSKTPPSPKSDSLPSAARPLGQASSRQGLLENQGSSSGQQGSPSRSPLLILPKPEGLLTHPGPEDQQACGQGGCPSVAAPKEPGSDRCRCPPTPAACPPALQSPGRTQCPSSFETSRTPKPEMSGRYPDTSITRTSAVSPEAPLPPTIEEKVMLCIQENVEKGQVQTKSPSVEAKPRPGPSFASWFGFRRSRLPALSSRKMEVSKTKVEKKDSKGLGFGSKQLKSERKKEKKKPQLPCETEKELHRDAERTDHPDGGVRNKNNLKTPQGIYDQMKFEPRNRPSPVTCSTKDTFMTELLNRVDKRAAQQTEIGSNSVSCRSALKGSSQGSCPSGSSLSAQGNHKKHIKTKADVDIPKGSLIKETKENLQEDEEDAVAESAFQSHVIESNCQMRTLDSGIGTFPLPDSGTRSAGRYMCQSDSTEDPEPILCLQPALCVIPSVRAQTLEREVPSSADGPRSADNSIVHSTSYPLMTARGMRPLQSRLPKPASSGKINSQKQTEAEPRPQTCSSFEYAGNTMARELLPDWIGGDSPADTQDKVPRTCPYSASGGSDSDSDLDYGNNGFGAGRGKLVRAMKSTTPEIETS